MVTEFNISYSTQLFRKISFGKEEIYFNKSQSLISRSRLNEMRKLNINFYVLMKIVEWLSENYTDMQINMCKINF